MTVKQLREALDECPDDIEVMVYDERNDGGWMTMSYARMVEDG